MPEFRLPTQVRQRSEQILEDYYSEYASDLTVSLYQIFAGLNKHFLNFYSMKQITEEALICMQLCGLQL